MAGIRDQLKGRAGKRTREKETTVAEEPRLPLATPALTRRGVIGVLILALIVLVGVKAMGRVWWCAQGDLYPWAWDVWSTHCSQHLVDPYTLSHLQHGLGLYLVLTALCRRRLTPDARLLLVAMVEVAWEITENTDWMIQRYRENTIALDYFGDSALNSLCDYLACVAGALLAMRLPWRVSLGLFLACEVICICWIRDSLLLNILMLFYSVEAIRKWQTPG